MGGLVTVGFRHRNGTVSAQIRHTDPMGYSLIHPGMLTGDDAFVADYISKAENPLNVSMAPRHYGLVVVDFMQNRLLSMQEYIFFGGISIPNMRLSIHPEQHDREKNIEVLNSLLEHDRLSIIMIDQSDPNYVFNPIAKIPITTKNALDLSSIALSLERRGKKLEIKFRKKNPGKLFAFKWGFGVDMSPLVHERFEHSRAGALAMMQRMRELGLDVDTEEWRALTDEKLPAVAA